MTVAEPGSEVPRLTPEQLTPEQFSEFLRWIFQSDQVPKVAKITIRAKLWLDSVEAFHLQEDKALQADNYEDNLEVHRLALSDLILQGETLVLSAKQNGLLAAAPFSLESLQSTLEALHVAFHCQHRPGNTVEANTQLAELFNAEERKD
jgi:hypothetical protein